MGKIAGIEQQLSDAGKVSAELALENKMLKLKISGEYAYPAEKVLDPALAIIDQLVDKLEAVIPGDQKAMAQEAKADARAAVMKWLESLTPQEA